MNINQICEQGHKNAVRRKAYGDNPEADIIGKLYEECEELFDAMDKNDYKRIVALPIDDNEFMKVFNDYIKDTVGAELADIVITACSASKELKIPLFHFINACLRYGSLRDD